MPQQQRKEIDFSPKPKSLLDDGATRELRLHQNPDYVPDINLFAVMFENGPEWVQTRADRYFADEGESRDTYGLHEFATKLAKDATIEIQREYDVCLTDEKIGQMYGMSHDFARLALGMRLPAPESRLKRTERPIRRKKRIFQFAGEVR